MQKRALMSSFVALAMSAGLVVACGDDDDSNTNVTPSPDGGSQPPDSGSPDPGNEKDAATPDSEAPAAAEITPLTTTRIANAINPYGLLYASDGFLYASGATNVAGTPKLAVWRFKDGALDTTFGTDGVVVAVLPGSWSSFDIVEVSAGNFVVHAVSSGKIYLLKLTKDNAGAFSFGPAVFVKLGYDEGEGWPAGTPNVPASAPSYTSWGIGLDKSNAASPKIVVFAAGAPAKAANVAEQRVDNDRWITRVDANTLAFDTTFNGGAPYTADADGKGLADNGRRGLVLADGSIVSSGYTNFGTGLGNHVVLIRLLANGTVDQAFGFGTTAPGIPGQTKFNPFVASGGSAEAYGVVHQSSGRYVTTGYGTSNFEIASKSVDLVSFGVKADSLDTTYGKQGSFAWQSENDKGAGLGGNPFTDRGRDIAVLPDDRLVHVGVYDDYASVFVTDKDGKPDPSSGNNGLIEYSYPAGFFKVVVSPDGKQIAATAQSLNQTTDANAPVGSVLATLKVGQ
ncbi:MAG: hypothetical protein BGO98_24445 [Myxococcales bacterium 68-20]|nr:MAG: hypothetical protein BGO98_24445 [Myxococcales bacterium 68-20]